MIRTLDTKSRNFQNKFEYYLNLRRKYSDSKTKTVKRIVKDIRKGKDNSLIKYEKKFNSLKKLNRNKLFFSNSEIKKNIKNLDPRVKSSIDLAFSRIVNFHKKQKFKGFKIKDKYDNVFSYRSKPIDKVGVYVPGGKASYPSSVLMNCIPAMIAGVREIFMTVPSLNNKANPGILYAAKKCKVKKIFKLGGAQAIAAFAFGTKTVTKVDKIVGPGNEYVSLAKKEISGETGIDMFAGPSEVTIIADKYSNPEWISADLIAQSEHDEMSQSILVTNSKDIIFKVKKFLEIQLKFLPKRKIASSSLGKFGLVILARNPREVSEIVNKISPEHLEIYTKKPDIYLKSVNNVGSVFLGAYSPEAVGDYLAGPNHVLPTSGTAKFSSGLSVYDFLKRQSVIRMTKRGIERLGPSVITLSKYENLHGHANSIKVRIKRR
ncbi:MAG: histidinol dehydrogenase [Rhodobacteraceae bacterium]|nr:MAG: histidinol dehydrogenase [Paracoccaceae bacterium]